MWLLLKQWTEYNGKLATCNFNDLLNLKPSRWNTQHSARCSCPAYEHNDVKIQTNYSRIKMPNLPETNYNVFLQRSFPQMTHLPTQSTKILNRLHCTKVTCQWSNTNTMLFTHYKTTQRWLPWLTNQIRSFCITWDIILCLFSNWVLALLRPEFGDLYSLWGRTK